MTRLVLVILLMNQSWHHCSAFVNLVLLTIPRFCNNKIDLDCFNLLKNQFKDLITNVNSG
jgi:hypothetical protein